MAVVVAAAAVAKCYLPVLADNHVCAAVGNYDAAIGAGGLVGSHFV